MAAEADFTWRKILSFFGVAFLAFIGIVSVSSGIGLAVAGKAFYGVATCLGGGCAFALCVIIYKSYERWSAERRKK